VLDTFYAQNLKLFVEGGVEVNGDNAVVIREDVLKQLERAQNIRDIFFSKQNGWARSLQWKLYRFPATNGAAC
jgi:type VI secretion system protein ImpL